MQCLVSFFAKLPDDKHGLQTYTLKGPCRRLTLIKILPYVSRKPGM